MCLFPHLVGQTPLKKRLSALMRDGTSRVFLFAGAKGMGKSAFGRALAQMILCDKPDEKGFCGDCNNCKYFSAGTHPDFTELSAKENDKNIRVSAVRERIISDVHLYPQISEKKVYLIQADDLNEEGQNALLKTLEEPPDFAYFILTISDAEHLQETVQSRMTVLPLQPLQVSEVVDVLRRNTQKSDDEICNVAQHAQGNVGRALLIAHDEAYDEIKNMAEESFFSISDASQTELLTDIYQTLDTYKNDIDIILLIFQRLIGELLRLHTQCRENNHNQVIASQKLQQMLEKNRMKSEHIQRASEAVTQAARALEGNCGFEVTICRMLLVIKKELTHA